jgi:hypothetical protein
MENIAAIALLVMIGSTAALDVVLTSCNQPTVSMHIRDWSRAYPALPLLVGVVMGHLFF